MGCFSHTIDHVGEHFVTSTLSEFGTAWLMLFSHSAKAKLLWKEQTAKSMPTYSLTRRWSKWETFHQLLFQFGNVLLFVERSDLSTTSKRKLLGILQDAPQSALLKIELAAVNDYGELVVK